jgi:hypothetical protein
VCSPAQTQIIVAKPMEIGMFLMQILKNVRLSCYFNELVYISD